MKNKYFCKTGKSISWPWIRFRILHPSALSCKMNMTWLFCLSVTLKSPDTFIILLLLFERSYSLSCSVVEAASATLNASYVTIPFAHHLILNESSKKLQICIQKCLIHAWYIAVPKTTCLGSKLKRLLKLFKMNLKSCGWCFIQIKLCWWCHKL